MTDRIHLDPEDADTAKVGALAGLSGAPFGLLGALGNALAGVVSHRSALNAAQDEWDRIHREEN